MPTDTERAALRRERMLATYRARRNGPSSLIQKLTENGRKGKEAGPEWQVRAR